MASDEFSVEMDDGTTREFTVESTPVEQGNTVCPGYGEESCGKPVEYEQILMNDPRSFCERHSLHAAAFWEDLGFGTPNYRRLADGVICSAASRQP